MRARELRGLDERFMDDGNTVWFWILCFSFLRGEDTFLGRIVVRRLILRSNVARKVAFIHR